MNELTIEVSVDTLLKKLETNREKHLKAYEKARVGWKKLLAKDLKALQVDLEAGKSIDSKRLYLKRKPEHQLHEYDGAIALLKFAQNPTMMVDQTQFEQYVQDNWNWKQNWTASNSTYIAAGRRR